MVNSEPTQNTLLLKCLHNAETLFIHELVYSAQYSDHSITAYGRDIGQLLAWLNTHHKEDEEVTLDYNTFADYFESKKFAPKTTRRKHTSISKFCQFLIKQSLIQSDAIKELTAPKLAKRLPNALAPDDLSNLLNSLTKKVNRESPAEVREWAILELLYSTGARVAELANIDLQDMDLASKQIRVIGKGNKERIVHIGEKAMTALEVWLSHRPTFNPRDNALFLNQRGNRLSIRSIQLHLKEIGYAHDANLNLHPHRLRHSFGGHIVQSGGDLRAVQEMLGHTSLAATQIYTHLDFQALAKVYDKAHPHAKKHKKEN